MHVIGYWHIGSSQKDGDVSLYHGQSVCKTQHLKKKL